MDALNTSQLRGRLILFLLGILLTHFFCPKAPYPDSKLSNTDLLLQSQSSGEADYELTCGVYTTTEGQPIFHCFEEDPEMATPQSLSSDFLKSSKSLTDYAYTIAGKFGIMKLAKAKYAIEFVNQLFYECTKNNIPTSSIVKRDDPYDLIKHTKDLQSHLDAEEGILFAITPNFFDYLYHTAQ